MKLLMPFSSKCSLDQKIIVVAVAVVVVALIVAAAVVHE